MLSTLKLLWSSTRDCSIHSSPRCMYSERSSLLQVESGDRVTGLLGFALTILGAMLISAPLPLSGAGIPLKPQGYVSDFANMLSPNARHQIEQLAVQLEKENRTELAVVIVPSIGDRSVQDYSTDLFAQWGIGKKGTDNGLLLLVAKNERQIWIEVGYGLEDKVPDAIAAEIYRVIRDRFRQGDFDGGVLTGTEMLASAVGGTLRLPPSSRRPPSRQHPSSSPGAGIWLLFGFFIFFGILKAIGRAAMGRPAVRSGSSFPWWLIFFLGSGRGGGSSWGGGGFSGGGGGFGGFGGGMSGGGGAGGGW